MKKNKIIAALSTAVLGLAMVGIAYAAPIDGSRNADSETGQHRVNMTEQNIDAMNKAMANNQDTVKDEVNQEKDRDGDKQNDKNSKKDASKAKDSQAPQTGPQMMDEQTFGQMSEFMDEQTFAQMTEMMNEQQTENMNEVHNSMVQNEQMVELHASMSDMHRSGGSTGSGQGQMMQR